MNSKDRKAYKCAHSVLLRALYRAKDAASSMDLLTQDHDPRLLHLCASDLNCMLSNVINMALTTRLEAFEDAIQPAKPKERTEEQAVPARPKAEIPPPLMCAVKDCEHPAACELGVGSEWVPVCHSHSVNQLRPRRKLRPQNPKVA